jgi:hypothetical protein
MSGNFPAVELRISIEGVEVYALLKNDMGLMCAESERDLVRAVLAEAMVMLCGTRPRAGDPEIVFRPTKLAPVLSIVRSGDSSPSDEPST